jgi:prepilin-type N-terminal cleavage/methylation domain-containing protein
MSSRFRERSRSAGFSLAEVLVALAIAALLTAMLVRFVVGTRANAGRIGETLEMATVAETLLARAVSAPSLHPGRTDGRVGSLRWRMEVHPIPFAAVASRVHERPAPASARVGGAKVRAEPAGKPMEGDEGGSERAAPKRTWTTYRVAVAVEAPSGRKHVADTIKVGPPPMAAQR